MNLLQKIDYAVHNPSHLNRFVKTSFAEAKYKFPGYDKAYLPQLIYLVVNQTCNLRCKMCDVGTATKNSSFHDKLKPGGTEFPLDKLKEFVDSVSSFKPMIAITSTEPLLYKPLFEACSYIKQHRMRVSVTTNGYLLEKFADKLSETQVDQITISIDGPSGIHNEIRGREDSFERIIAGIEALVDLKKNGKSIPKIYINYTISEWNFNHISRFLAQLEKYPIELFSFSHLSFVTKKMAEKHNQTCGKYGRSRPSCVSDISFDNINFSQLYDEISRSKREYTHLPMVFSPHFKDERQLSDYYLNHNVKMGKETCFIPWKYMQVLANGDVTVLTRCFDVTFGNIFENDIKDIWNGEKMREFRRGLKQHKTFPACQRCCGLF